MAQWLKTNKKFITALVMLILQNIGVVPPMVDTAPSVNTKAVP